MMYPIIYFLFTNISVFILFGNEIAIYFVIGIHEARIR